MISLTHCTQNKDFSLRFDNGFLYEIFNLTWANGTTSSNLPTGADHFTLLTFSQIQNVGSFFFRIFEPNVAFFHNESNMPFTIYHYSPTLLGDIQLNGKGTICFLPVIICCYPYLTATNVTMVWERC
ncbi:MAG: hypothetical protein HUK03_06430 [Bacteroidaceae bacterium]|nr:hypothetical protein [Bacteroidaceae bacterium]